MGTYIDIDGDPNEISATGAVLRALAESFNAKVTAIQVDIGATEAERPWGADKYGQAFDSAYNVTPEGGSTPFNQSVKDGMSHAGELLSTVGGAVVQAMNDYQGVDVESGHAIKRVTDQ